MAKKSTPHRFIGPDAIAGMHSVLTKHMPVKSLLLVCDDITWVAAGERIYTLLVQDYTITPYSLGRQPKASLETAKEVAEQAAEHDALMAVGSGTINDVTKYAAAQTEKPYVTIPTAASMNGYTSVTSSLETLGARRSMDAKAPVAVIADTTVLAAAPKRLTRAGLGDTLCRSSAEADMLLSHYLLGTPYPKVLYDNLRQHEAALIAEATSTRGGDTSYVGKLMVALLDTGDAMAAFGSSAIASQGEHMIAQTLELMYGKETRNALHGEIIAITTLTMNYLQHKMFLTTQPVVKSVPKETQIFERQFGKRAGTALTERYAKKVLTEEQVKDINARLSKEWPEIKTAIGGVMAQAVTIERAFLQSGLSTRAPDIGISAERYRSACSYAYMTRDRFGFLDLAMMNDRPAI